MWPGCHRSLTTFIYYEAPFGKTSTHLFLGQLGAYLAFGILSPTHTHTETHRDLVTHKAWGKKSHCPPAQNLPPADERKIFPVPFSCLSYPFTQTHSAALIQQNTILRILYSHTFMLTPGNVCGWHECLLLFLLHMLVFDESRSGFPTKTLLSDGLTRCPVQAGTVWLTLSQNILHLTNGF